MNRLPSKTTDSYWIFALNEKYKFKKEKSERASGKWLIFEYIDKVDDLWETIKKATEEGLLGPSSKSSTAKINPNAKDNETLVICVFTEDFNDKEDVKRIEQNLRNLGIQNTFIYKLDKDVGKYSKDGFTNLDQLVSHFKPITPQRK